MNYPTAHANIVAILNSMSPRPSLITWAAMMLWKTRVHPETGKFSETASGPNARFTQEEADLICHQVQMRASLPSAAYESKLTTEDQLDCTRMMLSMAKDYIDAPDEWSAENIQWLRESIAAVFTEQEARWEERGKQLAREALVQRTATNKEENVNVLARGESATSITPKPQ